MRKHIIGSGLSLAAVIVPAHADTAKQVSPAGAVVLTEAATPQRCAEGKHIKVTGDSVKHKDGSLDDGYLKISERSKASGSSGAADAVKFKHSDVIACDKIDRHIKITSDKAAADPYLKLSN